MTIEEVILKIKEKRGNAKRGKLLSEDGQQEAYYDGKLSAFREAIKILKEAD